VSDLPSSETTLLGAEREQLEAFLEDNRAEVVETLDGLTDEQARRRLVPSLTTPLGLLKHLTVVEQVWFHVAFEGRTRAELGIPENVDDSFVLTEDDTVASVLAEYHRVCAEARTIAAAYALDDVALHNRRSPLNLRWIYLHLIRELARHAGHGDILREQVLAADA
jgi:uncharacterized damage-inducible protein DinB